MGLLALGFFLGAAHASETVKIGFNCPETGPYAESGKDMIQAMDIAVKEINGAGGILGKPIELVRRDSESNLDVAKKNVDAMQDAGCKVVMGGASSGVAIGLTQYCQEQGVLFMAGMAASPKVTAQAATRHGFRACYNDAMAGRALAAYLKKNYAGKKFFYVTVDYVWGHGAEEMLRELTGTTDTKKHKSVKVPFPKNKDEDFVKALKLAKLVNPDVLALIFFGKDFGTAIRHATALGLKQDMAIVTPLINIVAARAGGAKVMEGVVSVADWVYSVPSTFDFAEGKAFVDTYARRFGEYPGWGAYIMYTNIHQYAEAANRAKSVEPAKMIPALEGHSFTLLKDEQTWRAFDHQCAQSVYLVKCKPAAAVLKDPYKQDFFEILETIPATKAMRSEQEWTALRKKAGKPAKLDALPGK